MCYHNATSLDLVVSMDYGSDFVFDGHYYDNIHLGRGVLVVDQALMRSPSTRKIVEAYALDDAKLYMDFVRAMVKLCNLNVLTSSHEQIRKECSKVNDIDESSRYRPSYGPSNPIP
eukprot:Gb_13393 [translate_table: standard]